MRIYGRGIALAVMLAIVASHALAQPRSGAIRLVVGFPAGGSLDRIARAIGHELAGATGRSVVVENVPGANSARAIARVVASEPTGDTLLVGSSALAHPDNLAAAAHLRPIMLMTTVPMVLCVRATMPVHDPRAFAAWLARHPGAAYGSSGVGNATHVAAAALVAHLGVEATHVPYSGSSPAFADLVAGRIDFLLTGANSSLGQHAQVRALAVTTASRSKTPGLETLPTIAETLAPGFDFGLWQALYAPLRTPDAVVDALAAHLREALGRQQLRAALAESGVEVLAGSAADAERMLHDEARRFRERSAP